MLSSSLDVARDAKYSCWYVSQESLNFLPNLSMLFTKNAQIKVTARHLLACFAITGPGAVTSSKQHWPGWLVFLHTKCAAYNTRFSYTLYIACQFIYRLNTAVSVGKDWWTTSRVQIQCIWSGSPVASNLQTTQCLLSRFRCPDTL